MTRARLLAVCALAGALFLSACATATTQAQHEHLKIFATTGYLADAVSNIAPEAEVITMVGPGGDPHTYQPTTKDIENMRDADLVLWNGLHLEAQMVRQLESLGDSQFAVGEALLEEGNTTLIPVESTGSEQAKKAPEVYDPHIWNDPELWQLVVTAIADKLAQVDETNADTYRTHAADYNAEIATAHAEASTLLAAVPEPRILVTGHDAFNYFGRTYNLDVRATDFISTEASLSATAIDELAELIAKNKIPQIFHDNQANPQAIKSLAEAVKSKGWRVVIARDELFADTLGAAPEVDSYTEVLLHNARAIATALS
ncbi:metal ABC transporter substrate-binding protein [Canibacter zhoujuaniae]|uniref:metal ABC transporter substrate-binding protein n=1 Tax=Canibacter zhoujuaniae TaxID=2708343 RepID=UPI00142094BB|nr:metal ABC transporter substrate-binding protein [Canibacter zhoujuaniae]